jgi:hypothetical protein
MDDEVDVDDEEADEQPKNKQLEEAPKRQSSPSEPLWRR